jgi:hypothetical protein
MQRIDTTTKFTDLFGPGKHGFRDGDKSLNIAATHFNAAWVNSVQEELCNVIEWAGYALDPNDNEQLLAAILLGKRNYIDGLILSNNAGTPNTKIDISAGIAMDNTNAHIMPSAATLTKILQSAGAFAAGTGNNGLFTGARANSTWYHVFLIRKTSDGSIDAGFDTSITAANIPAGYGAYRRIGSIKTDGSGDILAFTQSGEGFYWQQPLLDVSVTGLTNGTSTYAVNVPPDVVVEAIIQGYAASSLGSGTYHINTPSFNDVALYFAPTGVSPATGVAATFGRVRVLTNATQQVQFNTNLSGTDIHMGAYGWVDSRGKNS